MSAILNVLIVGGFLWGVFWLFTYSVRHAEELSGPRPASRDGDLTDGPEGGPEGGHEDREPRTDSGPRTPGSPKDRSDQAVDGADGRDPPVEPSPTPNGFPKGSTLDEYVTDGLLQIEVFLAQQARRAGGTPLPPDTQG